MGDRQSTMLKSINTKRLNHTHFSQCGYRKGGVQIIQYLYNYNDSEISIITFVEKVKETDKM